MYETICKKWRAHFGLASTNTTDLPTIVFWNLRANTTGSPVNSDTKGVIQISGYSASLVKMLLFGEQLSQESDEKPSPADVLNRTLATKEYDNVREVLGWSNGRLDKQSVFAVEVAEFIGDHVTMVETTRERTINVVTTSAVNLQDID